MRVYPPVYALGREATTDLELGGYRVKRGYTVLMSQWVNHRDPRYFPEPGAVRPRTLGRWTGETSAEVRLLSVRRGTTNVRRQSFRQRRGDDRACHSRAKIEVHAFEPDAVIDIKAQITLLPKYGIPATLRHR